MPKPGDYFLVTNGLVHAVGRYGCGAAVLLGAGSADQLTLDVNAMTVHLPQIYGKDEVTPLAKVRLGDHGLCARCRGWGLTRMFPSATAAQIIDGKHGEVCASCEGSGRTGVLCLVERTPERTSGTVSIAPGTPTPSCEMCAVAYTSMPE